MKKKLLKKIKGKTIAAMLALGLPFCAFADPDCQNYGNGDAVNILYSVNGNSVGSLSGNVFSGDTVKVCFEVSPGSDPTIFSLVSYSAPSATFDVNTAYLQTIYDMDSQTFACGQTHCLTVIIPNCYFPVSYTHLTLPTNREV